MKLFITDEELIAVLSLPKVRGHRILTELTKQRVRAPFPKRDPLFGDRRYLPAVLQWFDDYFGVRADGRNHVATWEERFDVGNTRAGLAKTKTQWINGVLVGETRYSQTGVRNTDAPSMERDPADG